MDNKKIKLIRVTKITVRTLYDLIADRDTMGVLQNVYQGS